MPTQLTIPLKPQFGVGQFEAGATFDGLKGLRFAWETTFGILLPTFDEAFTSFGKGSTAPLPPNLFATHGHITLANIGKGLTATQHAKITEHVQGAFVTDGLASSIERAALDILHEKKKTAQKTRPRVIIRVVKPNVKAQLRPVLKRAKAAEDRAAKAEAEVKAQRARIAALERKVAKPHTVAWPGIPGRVGELERERARDRGDIGKLKKLLGLAALAALVAKVLEKMGANWIRCSRSRRYGRALCGMNDSWLDSLISDALLVVGAISVVAFAKELQTIEGEVVAGLERFVREI